MKISVHSEIGRLKKVMVHRPGKEVERLYPEIFAELLFDDIMHLPVAQKEHDAFTDLLRSEGVEVFYIEKLAAEVLSIDPKIRDQFIKEFISQAGIEDPQLFDAIYKYWSSFKCNQELVNSLIAGIKKNEVSIPNPSFSLKSIMNESHPFFIDPIPNILFQRDPFACVYNSISIHTMMYETRRREVIFYQYLLKHHPEFKDIPLAYDTSKHKGHIEGGDVLVLDKETLFIGNSQRTSALAIEELAKNLFAGSTDLKKIISVSIPKERACMHLDTVCTMLDKNKFSVDADLANEDYNYVVLTKNSDGSIAFKEECGKIKDMIHKYIVKDPIFFEVGNNDPVRAKREQWNDGANSLAIAPGKIVVYDRNYITNELMRKGGVTVLEVPSSELSRGRGGPRCMTMPLEREAV